MAENKYNPQSQLTLFNNEEAKEIKNRDEFTPLMQQYYFIKSRYPGMILFFRLGDFYEMFGEDAKIASQILEITLTKRQNVPMCGVPHHTAINYIAKLVRAGYKIAICDQVEDPKLAKGLVRREVTRVITPGTVLEENLLDVKSNNYLLSIYNENANFGLSYVDISTGTFLGTEIYNDTNYTQLELELARSTPAEVLLPTELGSNNKLLHLVKLYTSSIEYYKREDISFYSVEEFLKSKGIYSLAGYGLENKKLFLYSSAALFKYIEDTQGKILQYLQLPKFFYPDEYVVLEDVAIRNLELVTNLTTGTRKGSLLDTIDRTVTPMGGRLLRYWLLHPLRNVEKILERQALVEIFYEDMATTQKVVAELKRICDIERITIKISLGKAVPRDLITLRDSLSRIPNIKNILNEKYVKGIQKNTLMKKLIDRLYDVQPLVDLITSAIVDDPGTDFATGKIIKDGYSQELDNYRNIAHNIKHWIAAFEIRERQRTGISSLKVGYNTIFGYYIEVTKPNLHLVPQNYIRKQTLSNAERFYTQELKNKEIEVLESEEKIEELQRTIFNEICKEIDNHRQQIQHLSSTLAELDIYTALAILARENDYSKPIINDNFVIDIKEGRHPVVEKSVPIRFVPNDTYLDGKDTQIIILTGPNMAGKSTYIRQVALIVILAQMGGFVPAKSATIGIVDRIFTRIGAGENLHSGKSTFMVEMTETAYILNNVTERSLVILDEIGRGTSTFDGISIAWACIEYLNKQRTISNYGPKVLCATHYFELTYLANILDGVKNYNISVKEWGDQVVFLHKIVEGPADKSYGIYVAKLAGLPQEVIMRAKEIIKFLESSTTKYNFRERDRQREESLPALINKTAPNDIINDIINEIKEADLDNLTPLEIFNKVAQWKKMLNNGN